MLTILDLLRDAGATIGTDNNQCEVVIIDLNKWRCFVNSVKTLNQDVAKLSEERDALQAKLNNGVRVEIMVDHLPLIGRTETALFNSDTPNATLVLDDDV